VESTFQGTDRFEVRRQIGSGGFGVVYEAFDREQGIPVALKTVRSLEAEAIRHFKREFRALTDFVHPNLVSLYELFSEGDQWFFTMELVRGVDFLSYVRPGYQAGADETLNLSIISDDLYGSTEARSSGGGMVAVVPDARGVLSIERLRSAIEQIVVAVGAMHEGDILHRDLKPSNVMVDAQDRLVVLDFGLAAELAARRHGRQRVRIGTPAYMAPEIAAGTGATPACDWYAVGCMLYEGLTGEVPFLGTPRQILAAKRMQPARDVRELAPDAPEDLAELCMALLRTEPARRPSLMAIRKTLGVRAGASGRSRFVGRESELAALEAHITHVLPGAPRAVLVTGPSGMGKSVLVDQLVADIRDDVDVRVFAGRCYERESVPFKALDELVDDIAAHVGTLPAGDRVRLQPDHDAAMMRVFPSFEGVFERTSPVRLEAGELRRRAGLGLRDLLRRMTEEAFVVLSIDDVQWGDADSAAMLVDLLQPPDAPGVFVLATLRPEGRDAPVPEALSELRRMGVAVEEVAVGPLDDAVATRMLEGRIPDSLLPTVLAEAHGIPFLLDALARHVSEFGAEASVSVAGIVRARMERLSDAARRLLEIIAVAGGPLSRQVLREASALPGDQAAISRLVRAHLVRSIGTLGNERVVAYHDRVRETVVEDLEDAVSVHRALAEAMDARGYDAERRFVHHREAGNVERARILAIEAAENAADALAFAHAAGLYAEAIALGADGPAVQEARAQALVAAGRPFDAAEAYLAAVQVMEASGGTDSDAAIALRRQAAEQFLAGGHTDRGVAEIRRVLDAFGLSLAATPKTALARFLWNRSRLWVRGLSYTLREDIPKRALLEVDVLWSVASAMAIIDTIRATDFQVRHLLRALQVGDAWRICRALALEAAYAVTESPKNLPRSQEILDEAEALAKTLDHPHGRAIVELQRGIRNFLVSRWPESCEALERAETLLRECHDVTWELSQHITFYVDALSLRGDWGRLRRIVGPRLTEAKQNGNLQLTHYLQYAQAAFVRIAEDDPEAGLASMDATFTERSAEHGYTYAEWWRSMGYSLLHAYAGDTERAWAVWEAEWPALQGSLFLRVDVMNVPARFHRARLALARHRDAGDAAMVSLARKEAATIGRSAASWGPALSRFLDGLVLGHRGRMDDAVVALLDAETRLLEVDMRLHAFSARLRRGQWANDTALVESATRSIRGLGIAHPARFADLFAPVPTEG
jgi:hypothetical protein